MNTTIKLVDVFGQFDNQGTDHYFTYFPEGKETVTGWRNVMKDPRNEVAANMQQCYVIWCTATDWWIAKIVRNPHDSRGGFAMLSLCLGPNRPQNGEKAIEVLDNLSHFFIIEKHWDMADAEKALMNQEQDFYLVPCALRKFVEPTAAINSAYRSYMSRAELGACLSYLPQSGYEEFSRIFLVPKEEAQGMPVRCLDERMPLKRFYSIVCPSNCSLSPNKSEVMDGEELTLEYTKPGVEPFRDKIKGGENSDYAYVMGDVMQIRPGYEVPRVVHDRVITVKCYDKDNRIVEKFYLINYKTQTGVKIRENQVIVPENFADRIFLEITTSDGKYEKGRADFALAELNENVVVAILQPKAYKVVFQIGTTDFETTELVNPATARTKWRDYDLKIDDTSKTIYVVVHRKFVEKHHEEPKEFPKETSRERVSWLKLLLVGLVGVLLCYGIYAAAAAWAFRVTPWPFGTKTSKVESPVPPQSPVQPQQDVQPEEPEVDTMAIMRQHDIAYLKKQDKWQMDSLQTPQFQSLYKAMSEGAIDKFVELNDQLFGEEDEINGYYENIVKNLKEVIGANDSQKTKNASDEMRRIIGSRGYIDLSRLLSSIQTIAKPNPSAPKQKKNSSSNTSNPSTKQPNISSRPNSDE